MVLRILLVDSHILFREGLASLLADYQDLRVVGQVDCAAEVLERVQELQPHIILLEIVLSDGSSLELIHPLHTLWPELKVIILTTQYSDESLFTAIRAGAKGYLLKDSSISSVVASLRAVAHNEYALTREMTRRLLEDLSQIDSYFYRDHPGLHRLTARELETLNLLGKNLTNQEIASTLNITVNTTKVHVHKILEKLKLQNRREAAALARRHFGLNSSNIFVSNSNRKE